MAPSFSLGIQPVGINNAVISPHEIKAPKLGITIAERDLPTLCTICFMFFSSCISQTLILIYFKERISKNARKTYTELAYLYGVKSKEYAHPP
jgi:hypothetical protein